MLSITYMPPSGGFLRSRFGAGSTVEAEALWKQKNTFGSCGEKATLRADTVEKGAARLI